MLTAALLLTIAIHMTLPADAPKAEVADKLRAAAREAGCTSPVVEMVLTSPDAPLSMRVWCRDEPPAPVRARPSAVAP